MSDKELERLIKTAVNSIPIPCMGTVMGSISKDPSENIKRKRKLIRRK